MKWYTIAVFEDHPEADSAAYRQVFENDAYPAEVKTRVFANDEFEALDRAGYMFRNQG